jgi:hypothetical protein
MVLFYCLNKWMGNDMNKNFIIVTGFSENQ